MAVIPAKVKEADYFAKIVAAGLPLRNQGKVRDNFVFPLRPDLMPSVASDRLSIFDYVMPVIVPDKGAVLTALTVFWLTEVLSDFDNHLIAYGANIDAYLPEPLRGNADL